MNYRNLIRERGCQGCVIRSSDSTTDIMCAAALDAARNVLAQEIDMRDYGIDSRSMGRLALSSVHEDVRQKANDAVVTRCIELRRVLSQTAADSLLSIMV